MNERIYVAEKAARLAGEYLLKRYGKPHKILQKPDRSTLLSEDVESERIIIQTIRDRFPDDTVLTEESEQPTKDQDIWYIDPICGTYSYLRGIETWSVSLGFARGGNLEFGVVEYPVLGKHYLGVRGRGVTVNGKKTALSSVSSLSQSFISVEHAVFLSGKYDIVTLLSDIKRVRVGHASGIELAYVATGVLDAVIKTDQSVTHYAGGRALVEAAGGLFVDFTGQPLPVPADKRTTVDYIACIPQLAGKLIRYRT